ncbi:MAG: phage protein GemA/Gp16 family protein [Intestinimonas sp.]
MPGDGAGEPDGADGPGAAAAGTEHGPDEGRGQRAPRRKRTDAGGNPETAALRRKLYALCREMGRAEPEKVVNGLARRMFGVERQEWLTAAQCQKLAEALKAMARREAAHEA